MKQLILILLSLFILSSCSQDKGMLLENEANKILKESLANGGKKTFHKKEYIAPLFKEGDIVRVQNFITLVKSQYRDDKGYFYKLFGLAHMYNKGYMGYSLNSYAYENEINNLSEDEKDKYIFGREPSDIIKQKVKLPKYKIGQKTRYGGTKTEIIGIKIFSNGDFYYILDGIFGTQYIYKNPSVTLPIMINENEM